MKIYHYMMLSLCMLLLACSSSDDLGGLNYYLSTVDTEDVIISDNKREASIVSHGGGQYKICINGEFVNIVFDSTVDWVSVSYSNNVIIVNVSRPSGFQSTGIIYFTVFNDYKSTSGKISVKFEEYNYEDLLKRESKAIDYFFKDQILSETTPTNIGKFQVGEDAPFYYIDERHNVAMRILSMGDGERVDDGDYIRFQYKRYNLMSYFTTGVMPKPEGNYDSLTQNETSFVFNDFITPSSAQWGRGIQMPLQIGVPLGSTVQLVMTATEGPIGEISYAIPYFYEITYTILADVVWYEFPYARVHVAFNTQAIYQSYGVSSPATWRFFNIASNKPYNFPFDDNGATGLGGIFLIQDVNGRTMAFDASCPVECQSNITIWLDSETGIANCKTCGSEYGVFQNNGNPISGKALEKNRSLKEYNVIFGSAPYCLIAN